VYLDSTLMALVQDNLVHVRKLGDNFVGRPVLDLGAAVGTALGLVLSQEVFVVKSIEVCSFSLVRVSW